MIDEWENEPGIDRRKDEETGLDCMILRHSTLLHLCGYVGVPLSEDALKTVDFEVHGGITYCRPYYPNSKEKLTGITVIGFDCAHCGNFVPSVPSRFSFGGYRTYRNWDYVKGEVAYLARQVEELLKVVNLLEGTTDAD